MNYPLAGIIVVLVIVGIIWLVKRNRKDEKEFEDELNNTKVNPGTNDEPVDLP